MRTITITEGEHSETSIHIEVEGFTFVYDVIGTLLRAQRYIELEIEKERKSHATKAPKPGIWEFPGPDSDQ